MITALLPSALENPIDQFHLGVRYSRSRRAAPKLAFEWFRKAAKQGYAPAQHSLGECYATGLGTSRDEVLAAHWYQKAAQQGHAGAQCNLGRCYIIGAGVPIDDSLAFFWTHKAAVQGDISAQCNLGYLYSEGRGTSISRSIAAAWYKKAANRGSDLAEAKYNELRSRGVKTASLKGLGEMDSLSPATGPKRTPMPQNSESNRSLSKYQSNGRAGVTSCPTCNARIANHALKSHLREYHRPEPILDQNTSKQRPTTKTFGPDLSVLPTPSSCAIAVENRTSLDSLCPRCGGDGGVRGGCRKCDGTGWVSSAMEHDLLYRPDKAIEENSRISNADYGINDGAHFRESDGRIGTNPSHDDYTEESAC